MKNCISLLKIDEKPSLTLQNGAMKPLGSIIVILQVRGTILAQNLIKGAKRKNRPGVTTALVVYVILYVNRVHRRITILQRYGWKFSTWHSFIVKYISKRSVRPYRGAARKVFHAPPQNPLKFGIRVFFIGNFAVPSLFCQMIWIFGYVGVG